MDEITKGPVSYSVPRPNLYLFPGWNISLLPSWSQLFLYFRLERKLLPSLLCVYYEPQRSRNLFNTQVWSPSCLQSWPRDAGLIWFLPELEADKLGASLVRHTFPEKASEDIHSPGQAFRAPWFQAAGSSDLSQIRPVRRIWRGRLLTWGVSLTPRPNPWRLFLCCSLLPPPHF